MPRNRALSDSSRVRAVEMNMCTLVISMCGAGFSDGGRLMVGSTALVRRSQIALKCVYIFSIVCFGFLYPTKDLLYSLLIDWTDVQ